MKRCLITLLLALVLLSGCGNPSAFQEETESPKPVEAAAPELPVYVYLGVEDYGTVKAADMDDFRYRFYDGTDTVTFALASDPECTVQNNLQEGRAYRLGIEDGVIVYAAPAATVFGTVTRADAQSAVIGGKELEYANVCRATLEAGGARVEPGKLTEGETVRAALDDVSGTLYVSAAPQRYHAPVAGTAGERTLLNLLKTAMMPFGTTLYVYGGGWNWQDDGASRAAASVGLSPDWVTFFQTQDADYHYKNGDAAHSFYPFGGFNEYGFAGLDCSGFVGWVLYNTMYDHDGEAGLVFSADEAARKLAENGWGRVLPDTRSVCPGDIISMSGHVWIALGTCADGSILLVHSTPSASKTGALGGGVQLSALSAQTGCDAERLAQETMTRYYPAWSERYNVLTCAPETYLAGELFRWGDALEDPEGVQTMTAEAVLQLLFSDANGD